MKSRILKGLAVASLTVGYLVTPYSVYADDVKGPIAASMVMVPDLYGKSLTEAIRILNNAGLGRETQLSDRDGELRYVIRQDPAARSRVPRGTVVKIYGQLASSFNANDDVKGPVAPLRR